MWNEKHVILLLIVITRIKIIVINGVGIVGYSSGHGEGENYNKRKWEEGVIS